MTSLSLQSKSAPRKFLTGLAAAALITVSGCGGETTPALDPRPVRIGVQDNTTCAPFFLARGAGYFAEEGITAEIIPYPSGKLAFRAMEEGEVDLAAASGAVIAARAFDRTDFSVIATLAAVENSAWIVARRDRGIEKPADLAGKTVATQKDSAVHFFLDRFLAWNRIPESEVTVRFMKGAELPGALIAGRIDAFSMRNPFARQALRALGERAIEFYAPDAYRQLFNLAVTDDFLDQREETVIGVLDALERAVALIYSDEERAQNLVIAELGDERSEEVRADWERNRFTLRLDQDLLSLLDSQGRWRAENTGLPFSASPNFLSLIDPAPLNTASPGSCLLIGLEGEE